MYITIESVIKMYNIVLSLLCFVLVFFCINCGYFREFILNKDIYKIISYAISASTLEIISLSYYIWMMIELCRLHKGFGKTIIFHTYALTRSFTRSLTDLLTHSLTYPFIYICLFYMFFLR